MQIPARLCLPACACENERKKEMFVCEVISRGGRVLMCLCVCASLLHILLLLKL